MVSNAATSLPFVVTNNHVLDPEAKIIGLRFHVKDGNNDAPLPGAGELLCFHLNQMNVARHPTSDLAVILLYPMLGLMKSHGILWEPYIKCLDTNTLPTVQAVHGFSAIEDVIMIGYPNNIYDSYNNFPVVRRGITATPYQSDYLGRPEFLADVPVFAGSSGSPILIANQGSYNTGDGGFAVGTRLMLIGVLYAGHTHVVDGSVLTETVPTSLLPTARSTHMMNLGICIKSKIIDELCLPLLVAASSPAT